MEVVLNINDLNYLDIFENITLSIEKGTIVIISGPNKCGKTTLCRILDRKVIGNYNINLKGKDIKEYQLEEYDHLIQVIYPNNSNWIENTPLEEIERITCSKEKKDFIVKKLDTLKISDKLISKLSTLEIIFLQILKASLKSDEIVIIDNMDQYLNKKDLDIVYDLIEIIKSKFKLSFIITTTSLENALKANKLYVIKEGKIILHGEPLTVLQNDNILNKAGLNVPFMIDLSVKLRDYELIKNVELDKERLIETLWN